MSRQDDETAALQPGHDGTASQPGADTSLSAWAPLRQPLFRALWIATVVSNIGSWMQGMGAGWLMTELSSSPVMVALVQTATTLPIFLLALPAGAFSDIIDRRRYLIVVQTWMACVAALLGFLTLADLTTAWTLAALTFAMGVGAALMLPAWAAITPEIVSRRQLAPAIALNSLGINAARGAGPALAGVVISFAGTGAVFVLNAVSYLGVIFVLSRWSRRSTASELPAERFFGAMRAGFRFFWNSPELHAAVIRGIAFFIFASASLALLPLIAKQLTGGGPQAFGILSGAVGVGAVCGAVVLPVVRARLSRDALIAGATILYAVSILALAELDKLWALSIAMAASGVAWIAIMSSLQVAAQMALPNWVRSRGLAIFMMAFQGAIALGSVVWGKLAAIYGISASLTMAAIGALLAAALTWRWHVNGSDDIDLSPSLHWPSPTSDVRLTPDRGPVLVTIQYDVRDDARDRFVDVVRRLGEYRRRNGAFAWGIFEDVNKANRYIEIFGDESWLDHLRQHERVSIAERILQQELRTMLVDGTAPIVTHNVAPERPRPVRTQDV